MEFDDIARVVGDPGRRAQPSSSMCIRPAWPSLSAQAALAAFNPASLKKAWRADGSPPEMSSQKNWPAATCLPTSSAFDATRTPDASIIVAVIAGPKIVARANGSAWAYAGPGPRNLTPKTPFCGPQILAAIRSLQTTVP